MTIGREEQSACADDAWVAFRAASAAIDRIENAYRDPAVARTLGDSTEFALVALRDSLPVLRDAALRLDRCVAARH